MVSQAWSRGGASPPRLLALVRRAIRVRHYSRRTEEAYVSWIRRFVRFHGTRHPTELTERYVARFLSLANEALTAQVTGDPSLERVMRFPLKGTIALCIALLAGCGDDSTQPALDPLAVTTMTLPKGAPTFAYDQTLQATGGDGSYTWAVTDGVLPTGLGLNTSTGRIMGTPTGATQTFTVRVTSGDGQTDTQTLTLTINMAFNLDFGGTFTGLPDTYGAASGLTGTWVDVPCGPCGTTDALVNTVGTATTVSIELTGLGDTFNPQTTIESILLRDAVVNDDDPPFGSAFSATLTGLQDGQYDVYYYNHSATSGMSVNGTAMNNLAGGSPDALEDRGTNWDVTTGVTVTGGTLTIIDADGGFFDGLSGIQLVHVP